jgi:phage shock protein PspC (stress-responsive transcriptional regulator)
MNCGHCGQSVETDSTFCRFCGASIAAAGTGPRRRLTRIPANGQIAGVCAGIGAYLNVDVTLVRLAWTVLSIVPGGIIGGVIAYAAAWVVIAPTMERPLYSGRRIFRSSSDRKLGGVCGGLADYVGADSTVVRLTVVILAIYPGAIVLGLIAYAIAWFIIPPGPAVPMQPATSPA